LLAEHLVQEQRASLVLLKLFLVQQERRSLANQFLHFTFHEAELIGNEGILSLDEFGNAYLQQASREVLGSDLVSELLMDTEENGVSFNLLNSLLWANHLLDDGSFFLLLLSLSSRSREEPRLEHVLHKHWGHFD